MEANDGRRLNGGYRLRWPTSIVQLRHHKVQEHYARTRTHTPSFSHTRTHSNTFNQWSLLRWPVFYLLRWSVLAVVNWSMCYRRGGQSGFQHNITSGSWRNNTTVPRCRVVQVAMEILWLPWGSCGCHWDPVVAIWTMWLPCNSPVSMVITSSLFCPQRLFVLPCGHLSCVSYI